MASPSPRERPGRNPEAEADRLKKRFRAVSRKIESRDGGSRRSRSRPSARAGGGVPSLAMVAAVVLAIAVAVTLIG